MKKIIFIFFVLISISCDKNDLDINNIDDFNAYLDEELINQEIPALAVLIFKGETIKYERYLGQSNIENNSELTQNDIFLLASVSKMVTGVALLQLYENGEFDLDDRINDYLPFNINVPNQTNPITFRMLLTHSSAIKDGANAELFYSYGEDSPLALKTYMEKYLLPNGEYYDAADNFYNYEPGTGYNYSNMASALIGVLVEEISQENFRDYCRENIFQPLGMSNTYWSLDAALLSNKTLVQPYNENIEAVEHYSFPDYPNGALRSTARDMMKFLSALGQNGTFNNHQLLNENTVSEMLSQQIPSLDETMGLHTFLLYTAYDIWGHDGSEQGVSTEVGFNKNNKTGVIVLSNLQDVDVSSILLEAYKIGLEL